jgi:hypothetical protein
MKREGDDTDGMCLQMEDVGSRLRSLVALSRAITS